MPNAKNRINRINKDVLKWVQKDRYKELDQLDKKFCFLPTVEPGINNIDFNGLKKDGKTVFRSYDFTPVPERTLAGLVILYDEDIADIVLYSSWKKDPDTLEAVWRDYRLKASPFQIQKEELLARMADDGVLSICAQCSHTDVYQLLFRYYKWMYHILVSDEARDPENVPTLSPEEVAEVTRFLEHL